MRPDWVMAGRGGCCPFDAADPLWCSRSVSQEITDHSIEGEAVLDLSPVAAAAEDVQLAVIDPAAECERGLERDHLVVATMDQQRLVLDRPDVRLGKTHGLDP